MVDREFRAAVGSGDLRKALDCLDAMTFREFRGCLLYAGFSMTSAKRKRDIFQYNHGRLISACRAKCLPIDEGLRSK